MDDRGAELPTDFTTFILSLGTSTMVHLGECDAGDGMREPQLDMAKQTIGLLAMIEQKTSGNLSGEEERLLSQLLVDLRGRYEKKVIK